MKIKQFTGSRGTLASLAKHARYSEEIYWKISSASDRYRDVALDYMRYVPEDDFVRESVNRQRMVFKASHRSKPAQRFASLADRVYYWPRWTSSNGHPAFSVEYLLQPTTPNFEVVS